MVEADAAKLPERVIKDYNSDEVFSIGALRDHDGGVWIELGQRIPAPQVRKVPSK
jgi:hypothetical protein